MDIDVGNIMYEEFSSHDITPQQYVKTLLDEKKPFMFIYLDDLGPDEVMHIRTVANVPLDIQLALISSTSSVIQRHIKNPE